MKFLLDFNPWIGASSFLGTGGLTVSEYLYYLTKGNHFIIELPSGNALEPIVPVFFNLNIVVSGLYWPKNRDWVALPLGLPSDADYPLWVWGPLGT